MISLVGRKISVCWIVGTRVSDAIFWCFCVGFVVGLETEMKETELEDGVAILYRNDSSSIDPDISLSYLVRGHSGLSHILGLLTENCSLDFLTNEQHIVA